MNVGKLFKWIGGKKWLSNDLSKIIKKNISNKQVDCYIEPFAGGLGAFIHLIDDLRDNGIKKIILNDLNNNVISTYGFVKNDSSELFESFVSLVNNYQKTIPQKVYKLNKKDDKKEIKKLLENSRDFYLKKRKRFNIIKNKNNLESSVLFLFLMRYCFNGVYRENLKGEFNSPYNWEFGLLNVEDKLKSFNYYNKVFNEFNIVFENLDVFEFLNKYKNCYSNSLFYFDPPYLNKTVKNNENKTLSYEKHVEILCENKNNSSENKYNKEHFGNNHQVKLLGEINKITSVIFSNHSLNIFKTFSAENNFKHIIVYRSNVINSNKDDRKTKIPEILSFR
jgi:site-specific DNA-adenine methylase